MSLRFAIDGRVALHPRTGFGRICDNVLRRIASADPRNKYFFYFDQDPGEVMTRYPCAGHAFGGPREEIVWCNTFLLRQMKRDRIDVYVTILDKEIPFFPWSAKVISMVHDLSLINYPFNDFRNLAHKAWYHTLVRASVARSNLVLTNSEYSKREIVETLNVRPQKIRKITLGVDPPQPAGNDEIEEALQRYGVKKPYIFALGGTAPNQNNIATIRALQMIRDQFPRHHLVIGGGYGPRQEIPAEFRAAHIVLTGFIKDNDLPHLYRAADLFVFPSWHEGFGFPPIEAMAQGVPVIVSDVTALPEVCGDAALYVDPMSPTDVAEKIEFVLSNQDLADEMRGKGLRRVQSFRWETTCRDITAACEELCVS